MLSGEEAVAELFLDGGIEEGLHSLGSFKREGWDRVVYITRCGVVGLIGVMGVPQNARVVGMVGEMSSWYATVVFGEQHMVMPLKSVRRAGALGCTISNSRSSKLHRSKARHLAVVAVMFQFVNQCIAFEWWLSMFASRW